MEEEWVESLDLVTEGGGTKWGWVLQIYTEIAVPPEEKSS